MSNRKSGVYERLKPAYPSQAPLSLDIFASVEGLLWVGTQMRGAITPQKAYLLLTDYHKIGRNHFSSCDYLLQQARRAWPTFRSKAQWQDALKRYLLPCYDGMRLYAVDLEAETYGRTTAVDLFYPNREAELEAMAMGGDAKQSRQPAIAKAGMYTYKSYNKETVEVNLPEGIAREANQVPMAPRQEPCAPISITLAELYRAGKEMAAILPHDPCGDIFRRNQLQAPVAQGLVQQDALTISQVTNVVGMVGAGKSTLVKLLSFALAKQGKRIVLVLDTVMEVMRLVEYFKQLGLDASPLVGKGDRLKYIRQITPTGQMCLPESIAPYLTGCCIVDGLTEGEEAIPYGKEPCQTLRQGKSHYRCPYYHICPATIMEREVYTSSVIVTTAQGFASSTVGANRELLLEVALRTADLVVFDECDRVQKALDTFFTPDASFDQFIREGAYECSVFMAKTSHARRENKELNRYCQLMMQGLEVLDGVLNSFQLELGAWKAMIEGATFSAFTLLESLHKDSRDPLPEPLYHQLSDMVQGYAQSDGGSGDLLEQALDSCTRADRWEHYQSTLTQWSAAHQLDMTETRKNQITVVLCLTYLDRHIAKLSDAYGTAKESGEDDIALFGFLQSRFRKQQTYLPGALMGNLFGVKRTTAEDVVLFRQYAFGRSLMTELPWLELSPAGAPLGPNVLLLSGSSWAPGSYDYHVNRPVDYLLEAEEEKRLFLEGTTFAELGLETRISGAGDTEKRMALLKTLSKEVTATVAAELEKRNDKILIVVNSYAQGVVMRNALGQALQGYGYENAVCALVADGDHETEGTILHRGQVFQFQDHPSRILVAPASAIERGHNIVDETGHASIGSVFFFVRPMPVPEDMQRWNTKLNGAMAADCALTTAMDTVARNQRIRQKATKFWSELSKQHTGLAHLDPALQKDVVATLFVLILQIFGRMARITDLTRTAPSVYFVDGAFRKRSDAPDDFDCLDGLHQYLDDLMADEKDKEIARTLYGPFYKGFKKGIAYHGRK